MKKSLTYQRETTADAYRPTEPALSNERREDTEPEGHGLWRSLQFALEGFLHVAATQRSFRLQLGAAAATITAGICWHITPGEWAMVLLATALVLALEMINTAIEAISDMVTRDYHPLAKIAKDVSAGAVLVAAGFAAVVGIIVFAPHVWALWWR